MPCLERECHLYFSAADQIYKIIWSENDFNRFYDKTVVIAEEHNIDLPELPRYLRLQIGNGGWPNAFTSVTAYFPEILLKGCGLLHCGLEDRFN